MAIEIVDFPIQNGGSFHCYVKLPEGSQKIHWLWFQYVMILMKLVTGMDEPPQDDWGY